MGEWMHTSLFFNFGTSWRWMVSFNPLQVYPQGKEPLVSIGVKTNLTRFPWIPSCTTYSLLSPHYMFWSMLLKSVSGEIWFDLITTQWMQAIKWISPNWTGSWVDPRAGLDDKNWKFSMLTGLKLRPLGHPAYSQSLYWLCYHG
jgi:hypothetical protein